MQRAAARNLTLSALASNIFDMKAQGLDGILKNIMAESENKTSTTPPQSFLTVQISAFYFLIK